MTLKTCIWLDHLVSSSKVAIAIAIKVLQSYLATTLPWIILGVGVFARCRNYEFVRFFLS